jgi:hypothetical protein
MLPNHPHVPLSSAVEAAKWVRPTASEAQPVTVPIASEVHYV